MSTHECMYVCIYTEVYVMLTTVHHLLKKILMMGSIVGVTSQLANMGLKCN